MKDGSELPPFRTHPPSHPRRHRAACGSACGRRAASLARQQRSAAGPCRRASFRYGVVVRIHGLAWPVPFPIQAPSDLCDVTLYLTVIALFTLSPAVFDVAYYSALAGTSMALLTPDLWEQFPSLPTVQFFIAHGLVVTAVLYLVWSRLARPRKGLVARTMLALNLLAAFDGVFNWIFKTNFMYLCAKPARCLASRFFRTLALVHRRHRGHRLRLVPAAVHSLPPIRRASVARRGTGP